MAARSGSPPTVGNDQFRQSSRQACTLAFQTGRTILRPWGGGLRGVAAGVLCRAFPRVSLRPWGTIFPKRTEADEFRRPTISLDSRVHSRVYTGMGGKARMPQKLQIGVVARETGLTVDAIRFYEKCGLLKSPPRTEGGYRLFRPEDIQDLKFIRRAQDLGFSLEEIRELLFLQGESLEVCDHVRALLGQKLASVRGKIVELRKLERSLERSLQMCERKLKNATTAHADSCPVLNGLGRTKRASGGLNRES